MKKHFLLIVFIIPFMAFSQSYGARAGINFANMSMVEEETYDGNTTTTETDGQSNMGVSLAFFYDLALNENMFVELGAGYSKKGVKQVYTEDNYTSTEWYNLNYLEVPILFKYKKELNNMNVYGKIGPNIGYGISGKNKWEYTNGSETESGEGKENLFGNDDKKNLFKPLDLGLKFGAGVLAP